MSIAGERTMTESNQPAPPVPADKKDEAAEIFSVSQDKDGQFHFSRRDFLVFGMAAGGALLAKGLCPRFVQGSAASNPQLAGMVPLPAVPLHAGPSAESEVLDTLQMNDIVLLLADHPETGWLEAGTRSGKQGWLKRAFVDFSRAIRRKEPKFTSAVTGPRKVAQGKVTARLVKNPSGRQSLTGSSVACGNPLLNGDFESGHVNWVEESSRGANSIITNAWSTPYAGSYVARFGNGDYVTDKLTQTVHLPADLEDTQLLDFRLQSTTEETSTSSPYDWFVFRLLDGDGFVIMDDLTITDSTETYPDWAHVGIQMTGMAALADQDIQIQFEGHTDYSNISNFVIDSLIFNLNCTEVQELEYIFLPIVIRQEACTCDTAPCSCNSTPCSCDTTPCSCDTAPCSCNTNPCSTNTTCPGNSICPPVESCPLYTPPCYGNSVCPPVNDCPLYVVPCYGNSVCPPVSNCPLYNPCTCNLNPCSCNTLPCSCNAFPCSCNTLCTCNIAPCSCNAIPTICTCNVFPCSCNALPVCSIT
jgi:hypothetical protein